MSDWSDFFHVTSALLPGVVHLRPRGRTAKGVRRYVRDSGRRMGDALGTTMAGLVVSPRVLEILDGRTGWAPEPVRITLGDGRVEEQYAEIAISGRSGPLDKSFSEPTVIPPMVPRGEAQPGLRGLRFDPATWDGSDVFRPEGSELTLVVGGVAEALRRADLKNVLVEAVDDIEFFDV